MRGFLSPAGGTRLNEKRKLGNKYRIMCHKYLGSSKEVGIRVGKRKERLSRIHTRASRKREMHMLSLMEK